MSLLKKYEQRNKMTNEEKTLRKDHQIYCEMTGNLSNQKLNRKYKKYYLNK